MNSFQTIVLGVFGVFIIAGLMVIATTKSRGGAEATILTLWGTESAQNVNRLAGELFSSKVKVQYREISKDTFDQELVEALASNQGPDMILLPLDLLIRHRDKLFFVPYENFSERTFKDSFVQAGDGFLFPQGIAALPFSIDPLVMYWNRDMFDEGSVAAPPRFWDEFLLLSNRLTIRDRIGNITRSAVALGEYRNIAHAKEIITTMLLQAGNPIVGFAEGRPVVSLAQAGSDAVLNFYTEFSNPAKAVYSWNRSLSNSQASFLSGRLAVYFGFGSELSELRKGNPNLNFDVSAFPRPRNASVGITYGNIVGVAILKGTRNPSAALSAAFTLTGKEGIRMWSELSNLPPVRRDLLSAKPSDAFASVIYDGAIRARGFLDPYPARSSEVFKSMVESIVSGKNNTGGALTRAQAELGALAR